MFWSFTVWINCPDDIKFFVNSWPSASNFKSFSQSLELFFLTVISQNILRTNRQNCPKTVIVIHTVVIPNIPEFGQCWLYLPYVASIRWWIWKMGQKIVTKFQKKIDFFFNLINDLYTYLCRLCCLSAPADLFGILAEIGFLIRFKQTSINRKKPFCKSPKTSENVQTQVFDELFHQSYNKLS